MPSFYYNIFQDTYGLGDQSIVSVSLIKTSLTSIFGECACYEDILRRTCAAAHSYVR